MPHVQPHDLLFVLMCCTFALLSSSLWNGKVIQLTVWFLRDSLLQICFRVKTFKQCHNFYYSGILQHEMSLNLWGQGAECHTWTWNVPHRLMCWALVLSLWYYFWKCVSQLELVGESSHWEMYSSLPLHFLPARRWAVLLHHHASCHEFLPYYSLGATEPSDPELKSLKTWAKAYLFPLQVISSVPITVT